MDALDMLATSTRALLLDRQQLILENLALRQQVAGLRRDVKRTMLEDRERIT